MRRTVSNLTIPFLAPIILFVHAAYLDGSVLRSVPAITLSSAIPLVGIYAYHRRGVHRELREELRARRAFMITLGLAITSLRRLYERLGLGNLAYASFYYGLGTLITGIVTLFGHKASVHTMARSVSGFVELNMLARLGALMILTSIVSAVSRVKLGAHTRPQVLTGFLIGAAVYLVSMR